MRIFIEQGFEEVSIRKIADAIEYSATTIYLYFKDKNDIFKALHNEGFEKMLKEMQSINPALNPLEQLIVLGEKYVSFGITNPEYYKLMFETHLTLMSDRPCEEGDDSWRGEQLYSGLTQLVEACMQQGYFAPNHVPTIAMSLWSMVHGMVALHNKGHFFRYPKEHLEIVIKNAIRTQIESLQQK